MPTDPTDADWEEGVLEPYPPCSVVEEGDWEGLAGDVEDTGAGAAVVVVGNPVVPHSTSHQLAQMKFFWSNTVSLGHRNRKSRTCVAWSTKDKSSVL